MSHVPPTHTLASHLVNQTLASISVLETLSLINPADAQLIKSKLPPANGPFPSLATQSDMSTSFANLNVSPSPSSPYDQKGQPYQQQNQAPPTLPARSRPVTEVRAKALWDYHGAETDDLSFRAGDTIVIDEEVNEQWYRGRVIPSGQNYPLDRSGLFPANYTEKIALQNPPYYSGPPQPNQMVSYQPPGPPQPYGYSGPSQYQGQMQMMPPQQQLQGGVMVQQGPEKKNKFGRIGGQLGNAAVTGVGFGAGSAVASELVHAIF